MNIKVYVRVSIALFLVSCSPSPRQTWEYKLPDNRGYVQAHYNSGVAYFSIAATNVPVETLVSAVFTIYEEITGNPIRMIGYPSDMSERSCTVHFDKIPSTDILARLSEDLDITILIDGQNVTLEWSSHSSASGNSEPLTWPPPDPVIKDRMVYYAFTSDHEAPNEKENIRQFDFEAIYVVPAASKPDHDAKTSHPQRLTKVGKRREPAWTRQGNRLAYLDFSREWPESRAVVLDVTSGHEKVLPGARPASGLSWDSSATVLAYLSYSGNVCTYDLAASQETIHCSVDAESLALSPDSEKICFLTRDGEDTNDADGWLLNVLSLTSGDITQVGKTNDSFGLVGPFYWTPDSAFIVFEGFELDGEETRSYAWYKYGIETEKVRAYDGDFTDINDQRRRYWRTPKCTPESIQ